MTLIVPPGKKTGCLLRKTRYGEQCSLFGEKAKIIPQGEWQGLINARKAAGISARDFIDVIFDQDGVGSCASEALNQLHQAKRRLQGLPFIQFNPWFTYHHVSGGVDNGSSIDENLAFARKYGSCPEAVWPRSKGWRTKPPQEAYDAAAEHLMDEYLELGSVLEVGSALLSGFWVQFGWHSHSEVMIDLVTPQTGLVVNSWGLSGWQGSDGKGCHEVPLNAINWGYGCYAGRSGF